MSRGEYWYARLPEHPNSNCQGYILEHRVIMENKIGRLLDKSEIVHHKNDNKKDNRLNNLRLMTVKEHNQLHNRVNLIKLICPNCKKIFYHKPGYVRFKSKYNKSGKIFCSRKCGFNPPHNSNEIVKKTIEEKWDGTISKRQFAILHKLPISTTVRHLKGK